MTVDNATARDWRGGSEAPVDLELLSLIDRELRFQSETINLTAASNYLSPLVSAAMRPELNNIHCEGYAGKRYHEGQQNADAIERLAIERACDLFGAEHANVQPYRGTMANLAACMAAVDPGGTVLGFACDAGGHYTTGGSVHVTGRLFEVETYTVDPTSLVLDYGEIRRRAIEVRPAAIVGGDTAYPGEWDWPRLRAIADEVDAALIVDVSQTAGLILAGAMSSPVPHADIVTMATYKTLRGPRSGLILSNSEYAKRVDRAVHPVCQDGTNVSALAGLAAALYEAGQPCFAEYCHDVVANAVALAQGFCELDYDVVTGGTANHACLLDLSVFRIDASEAAAALASAGLVCNANQVPYDSGPPRNPSGLRLGTPAVTTIGMGLADMSTLVGFVDEVLTHSDRPLRVQQVGRRVRRFRARFATPGRTASLGAGVIDEALLARAGV